ncbi:MAG: mannitol dehydrogenase family protein [Anaerotruncus sp.]|nr:mannitol dehydrogenase family protein [Anaerotruncus sp.]
MLTLNHQAFEHREDWAAAGIRLPSFALTSLRTNTRQTPKWVHIGPGNIFRGYIAALGQAVLEQGGMESGITALSTFDHQIVEKIYRPYDDLALQVLMYADGKLEKNIIASIGESVRADLDWRRCKEIFASPSLQMVSFTITEKGYALCGMDGQYFPELLADFQADIRTNAPQNGMAIVAALLLARYEAGAHPIAMVSMDNFSHNGERLQKSVCEVANHWVEQSIAPADFLQYLENPQTVSFPCTCIDKITPRPDAGVASALEQAGFGSTQVEITDKGTYIAPFVNAEAPQYLVIEDRFPNGRPPLELAGVYFTNRETVDSFERMKVCTCLNPLHTGLAIFGCLLGFERISAEMDDPQLAALARRIGEVEGMPVVSDPGILRPQDFLAEVLEQRLVNPYIPDTPQRIATDTSQKLAIRFGQTIRLYRQKMGTEQLVAIPLVLAGWCRYLLGVDDLGAAMPLSPDPLLPQLQQKLEGIRLGEPSGAKDKLKSLLSNPQIFGCSLYEDRLGERIEAYFERMLTGPGAVRSLLKEVLSQ